MANVPESWVGKKVWVWANTDKEHMEGVLREANDRGIVLNTGQHTHEGGEVSPELEGLEMRTEVLAFVPWHIVNTILLRRLIPTERKRTNRYTLAYSHYIDQPYRR